MLTHKPITSTTPRTLFMPLWLLLFLLMSLFSTNVIAAVPVIYQEETPDLSIKVLGGYINVVRAFVDGHWVVNQNWQPLKITYDSFDGSVKTFGRGRHEYTKLGIGVYRDSSYYSIRQFASNFTWSDRAGNSITYDGTGIPLSYADRNGVGGTFIFATAASGAKQLTGVRDQLGNQVLWIDYTGDDLARAYDYTNREVRYTYNANHELTDFTDANGQVWKYGYTNGVPTSVTDPEKRTTTRTWTSNGEIGSIRFGDNTGADYVQDYDSSKSLYFTRETTTGGRVTETWSTLGQKLIRKDVGGVTFIKAVPQTPTTRTRTTTDARGLTITETLDEWDNVLKTTYQDGSFVSTSYDPVYSNPLTYTNEMGVVTKLDYDGKGNLLRVTEALGLPEQRLTEMTYDQYGQRKTIKRLADANTAEAVIQFDYDTHGNVIKITDAENHATQFPSADYDVMGNPKTKIDARGKIWARTYDNRGMLLTSTDPLNHLNKYGYDKAGWLTSTTDAVNNLTQYTYNARGKVTVITDPYGGITRYDYNDANLITKVTDPDNHIQSAKYTPDGRAYQQIDGNNNVTEFVHGDVASGLNGLITKILYPTFSQEYKYDLRSRVTETIDVVDANTRLSTKSILNNIGNPTSITDKENKTTKIAYDNLQRVKTVTDMLQGITEYTYDNRDNLIAIKDANNKTRRFSYDRNNRAKTETRPLGQMINYVYDEVGHLIQLTDAKGQVQTFHYDDAGRQDITTYYATATDAAGNINALQTVTYTYNNLDALTGYRDGATTGTYTYDLKQLRNTGASINYGAFALAYQYDYFANGSKKSYTGPDGVTVNYTYDANNQLSTIQLPGGNITVNAYKWYKPSQITYPGGSITKQNFDPLMRLTDITVNNPSQVAVLNHHYTFDNANNIKTKTTERGNYSYTYDDLYRLKTATNPSPLPNESYTYDAVDSRLTDSKTTGLWSYNDNQQLTGVEAYTYAYDASGNTTQRLHTTLPSLNRRYVYDHLDQLTEVHDQNDALIATYSYDPFGHRIRKTVGATTTYFFYSDEGLIAEANGSGTVTRTYGFQPDGLWGTDPVYLRENNQTYYYLSDSQGTPQQLIAQDGTVVWSALADSFGNTSVDGASTITNNLRFAGQYYDAETGLHYNGSRYYDPLIGRYLSEDPIGVNGGMNLYAYVNGNPVNWIDPYGLFSISDPTTWPQPPQWMTDFAACFGDTLSFGITKWIRSKNDTNKYVDFCSDPCSYGKYSGFALDLFMGGKALWGKVARNRAVPRVAQRFCFVAGTLVRTPDGLKPIEEIQVGDQVESRDEVTQETTWKPVVQLIRNKDKATLNLILVDDDGNSDTIGATPEHPFRVEGQGWVPAGELKTGDKIITDTDKVLTLKSSVRDKEVHDTYNFEVADYHTYFVGTLGAWVHNTCFPDAKEIAKRLNTNERVFHTEVKAEIKADFKNEMKKINTNNPDIGISNDGHILLKNPKTGKVVDTGVPIDTYKR